MKINKTIKINISNHNNTELRNMKTKIANNSKITNHPKKRY